MSETTRGALVEQLRAVAGVADTGDEINAPGQAAQIAKHWWSPLSAGS